MALCCPKCFQNKVAEDFTVKNQSATGNCDFCENEDVPLIDPTELRELFLPLLDLYISADDRIYFDHQMDQAGTTDTYSLGELICDDWDIFNETMAQDRIDELLDEIYHGDKDPVDVHYYAHCANDGWIRKEEGVYESSAENTWHWFASHLKRERRFIIDEAPDEEIIRPERWIKQAIEELSATRRIKPNDILYRGRLGSQNNPKTMRGLLPLSQNDMGAPPSHLARASRANSEGIPVLYVATDIQTAVAESGRFPGATVSVRKVKPTEELILADLTAIERIIEPLGDLHLATHCKHNRLLRQLNIELSKPIHPDESTVEYVPTQYLAEAILDAGFDGFCYNSCLNRSGTNIVIFDPEKMQVTESGSVHYIKDVDFNVVDL